MQGNNQNIGTDLLSKQQNMPYLLSGKTTVISREKAEKQALRAPSPI